MVVEADIFPAALSCLKDPDEYVRKNVTTLMREITKHTPEVPTAYRTYPVNDFKMLGVTLESLFYQLFDTLCLKTV